jgi:hypothetical protein
LDEKIKNRQERQPAKKGKEVSGRRAAFLGALGGSTTSMRIENPERRVSRNGNTHERELFATDWLTAKS